ncbi:MAG TPA: hypothetical protein VJO33_15350 [Gemmatimonadaceae bacterium]|nr:hypothetical protein [Gemmatimonadaceae bacterium]
MRPLVKSSLSLAAAIVGVAALVAASPSSHRSGPPWISIEYPANPLDPSTRGAFLLVHAFHHQIPVSGLVRGTAEGIVGGERKSIALRFDATSRPGVFALRKQWSDDGVWSLVLSVVQHEDDVAQALVELGTDGGVTSIRVPTRREREWTIPRAITAQEIEQSLQSRTPRTAQTRR